MGKSYMLLFAENLRRGKSLRVHLLKVSLALRMHATLTHLSMQIAPLASESMIGYIRSNQSWQACKTESSRVQIPIKSIILDPSSPRVPCLTLTVLDTERANIFPPAGVHPQHSTGVSLKLDSCRMEIVGGLKLGRKKLKIYHLQSNAYLDIEPLCCLDFFVTPRLQRQGVGHHIFEVSPRSQLAIWFPAFHFCIFSLLWVLERKGRYCCSSRAVAFPQQLDTSSSHRTSTGQRHNSHRRGSPQNSNHLLRGSLLSMF